MINMLRADLYRAFRGKAVYIMLAVMAFIIGISIYGVQPGYMGIVGSVGEMTYGEQASVEYEDVFKDMTYEEVVNLPFKDYRKLMLKVKGYELDREILAANMNLYYIFIFIAAIAIASDFSGGCVKNTLSSAISRRKYFFSKLIFVNLFCLGILFFNTYAVYFSNLIFNSKNLASSLGTVTRITFLQIPPILALISILTGLAFALRRNALFNTISIPFIMVFQMLLGTAKTIFKIKDKYLYYELQIMLSKLARDPSNSYMLKCWLVCAAVMAVFYFIGYMSFRRSEIR